MDSILKKYAKLLVEYCLEIKEGEKLYIDASTAAEPLVREVYRAAYEAGGIVEYQLRFSEEKKIKYASAKGEQLDHVPILYKKAMEEFDAYLAIRAPHNLVENHSLDKEKSKRYSKAAKPTHDLYFQRTASGSLKRSLCQYPTHASAQMAGLSLEEYSHFVYNACRLFDEDPKASWLEVRENQQHIVDYLNQVDQVQYISPYTDIKFSVKGRKWINSDGRTNMPSGEVFTGPIEDSVNGHVYFSYPSIYSSNTVQGIKLKVKDGQVVSWEAEQGQELLDEIFEYPGARYFGEVAIGTNYNIQRATRNILFDEKIGGTIHMAVGQSYLQTGANNQSPIHWDMITDMKDGGQILADGKLIYENGKFLI